MMMGRSRSRIRRETSFSVPLRRLSFTATSPYRWGKAARGSEASRTSTPASRNPVAVSASVITAILYNGHFLPHPIPGNAEGLGADDQPQIDHFPVFHGQIRAHHIDPQRILEVQIHLSPQQGEIDLAFKSRRIVDGGAHRKAEHADQTESLLD